MQQATNPLTRSSQAEENLQWLRKITKRQEIWAMDTQHRLQAADPQVTPHSIAIIRLQDGSIIADVELRRGKESEKYVAAYETFQELVLTAGYDPNSTVILVCSKSEAVHPPDENQDPRPPKAIEILEIHRIHDYSSLQFFISGSPFEC
jgi:hypothetical protein